MSVAWQGFRCFGRLSVRRLDGDQNWRLLLKRLRSSSTREVLSDNLQLHFSNKAPPLAATVASMHSDSGGRHNPLTIFLPWIAAEDAHLERYRNLYLDLGFDVLTVRVHPTQVVFATTGAQLVAQAVLEFLTYHRNYDRLTVHAFSAGIYELGEVFVHIRKTGDKYTDLLPRFKAQVYDSFADHTAASTGFSIALTNNPYLRKVVKALFQVQAIVMYPISTVHHKAALGAFYDNLISCPALIIDSKLDDVGSIPDTNRLVDTLREKGTDVTLRRFDDSQHVKHILKYPDLYTDDLLRLLRKVQLMP